MAEIPADQLVRWAAALTLADSYMSLVYHRGGIERWDTAGTPRSEDWQEAMHKCRKASNEARALLGNLGVDSHAVAREMKRTRWEPQPAI